MVLCHKIDFIGDANGTQRSLQLFDGQILTTRMDASNRIISNIIAINGLEAILVIHIRPRK